MGIETGKLPTYFPGVTPILAEDLNVMARATEAGNRLHGSHGIAVHSVQGGDQRQAGEPGAVLGEGQEAGRPEARVDRGHPQA